VRCLARDCGDRDDRRRAPGERILSDAMDPLHGSSEACHEELRTISISGERSQSAAFNGGAVLRNTLKNPDHALNARRADLFQ
jgi:hypothetical protein